MARHYSPPGTFEAIRKEVIEDPTWTAAAFRLAVYLTAKPDGWVLYVKPLADGTGLKPSAVAAAIRELRGRGLVYDERVRNDKTGRFDRFEVRFRRDLVVAPSTTPPKNRGVDATSDNTVPPQADTTPPKNGGVDTSTPPKNTEVDTTCTNDMFPQVAPPPDFSPPWQKIGTNREDGSKDLDLREDGLTTSELKPSARARARSAIADGSKTSPTTEGQDPKPAKDTGPVAVQTPTTPQPPASRTTTTEGNTPMDHDQLDLGITAGPQEPTAKGTRVPPDLPDRLRADATFVAWLRAECPSIDARHEMAQFMDYWLAASGQRASKRDWTATARTWMRKAQKDAGGRAGQNGHRSAPANGRHPRYDQQPSAAAYKKGFA
jgi:hypothetical protein